MSVITFYIGEEFMKFKVFLSLVIIMFAFVMPTITNTHLVALNAASVDDKVSTTTTTDEENDEQIQSSKPNSTMLFVLLFLGILSAYWKYWSEKQKDKQKKEDS